nr:23S rRNA (pseudouridine(1915)-N(3))-methyltransferase RlmH [Desulfobulbaceae bacterium]
MKIECLFVGKTSERYLEDGIADFHKRLKPYADVSFKIIRDVKSKASDSEIKKREGQGILKAVSKDAFLVVLDPRGVKLTSEGLAQQIAGWQEQNRKLVSFIVGGSNGLSTEVQEQADYKLSLSPMTFTHDMTRLILLEQLYRAHSIIAGTKYHK